MERLPIPSVRDSTTANRRSDLAGRLEELHMTGVSGGTFDLLGVVDELVPRGSATRQPDERKHLDVLGDLLGYLARRMTDLHMARQEEVASFLGWLEDQLGCPIDHLSGKTYVGEYYTRPEGVSKLLETIERNYPSTTSLDVSRPEGYGAENPIRRRIVEGFDRSMTTLNPILAELEANDRLIDDLVYRLYGLNEDQISVVDETVRVHSALSGNA